MILRWLEGMAGGRREGAVAAANIPAGLWLQPPWGIWGPGAELRMREKQMEQHSSSGPCILHSKNGPSSSFELVSGSLSQLFERERRKQTCKAGTLG